MTGNFSIQDTADENIYSDEEIDEIDEIDSKDLNNFQDIEYLREQIRQDLLNTKLEEGSIWYLIGANHYEKILSAKVSTLDDLRYKVGPVRSSAIANSHGILINDESHPFKCVPESVFIKLIEILGSHGNPVTRKVIRNNVSGELEVEFFPPFFETHILTKPNFRASHSMNLQKSGVLISKTATFKELIIAIKRSVLKENMQKVRLWFVRLPDGEDLPNFVHVDAFVAKNFTKILIHLNMIDKSLESQNVCSEKYHVVVEGEDPSTCSFLVDKYVKELDQRFNSEYFKGGTLGLANLGNTCYMNSALQCLSHIPELNYYFRYNAHLKEINKTNPLGNGGNIALAFGSLLHKLYDKHASEVSFITPREFKYTIGQYSTQFRGYSQQDTQEFLSWLLDALHEDLNRIYEKPYYEKPELRDDEVDDPKAIARLADNCITKYKQRNDSVVVSLFTGLYQSTLVCPDCNKNSITFDPFNDLTLPLPIIKKWYHTFTVVNLGKDIPKMDYKIMRLETELDESCNFDDLLKYFKDFLGVNEKDLYLYELFNGFFYRDYQEKYSKLKFYPINELISDSDEVLVYIIPHDKSRDVVVPILNAANDTTGSYSSRSLFSIPLFVVLDKFNDLKDKHVIKEKALNTLSCLFQIDSKLISEKQNLDSFDDSGIKGNAQGIQYSAVWTEIPESKDCQPFTFFIQSDFNDHRKKHEQHMSTYTSSNGGIYTPQFRPNLNDLSKFVALSQEQEEGYEEVSSNPDDASFSNIAHSEISTGMNEDEYVIIPDVSNSTTSERIGTDKPEDVPTKEETGTRSHFESNSSNSTLSSGSSTPAQSDRFCLAERGSYLICVWDSLYFSEYLEDTEAHIWKNPKDIENPELSARRKKAEKQSKSTVSLFECLKNFSRPEILGNQDLWYCPRCKDHKQATKTIQIWETGEIVTMHLKRFQSFRTFSNKINMVVDFPIEGLDMTPYIAKPGSDPSDNVYDLVGVDNHYGGLGGGHYTASVKNFCDNSWYYYNDGSVSPIEDPKQCITSGAYLLFYRRRNIDKKLKNEKLGSLILQGRKEHEIFVQSERQKLSKLRQEITKYSNISHETNDPYPETDHRPNVDSLPSRKQRSGSFNMCSDDISADEDSDLNRRKQRLIRKKGCNDQINIKLQNPVGYSSSNLASPASSVSDDNQISDNSSITGSEEPDRKME